MTKRAGFRTSTRVQSHCSKCPPPHPLPPLPLQALSVAGLGAGLTEAVVVNPFEVVKVSLQANRDSFTKVRWNTRFSRGVFPLSCDASFSLSLAPQQPSSFAQARLIINSDGFGARGLNKGLTSTLGRHGVFNMIYFGFYFNVKDAIPSSPVTEPPPPSRPPGPLTDIYGGGGGDRKCLIV